MFDLDINDYKCQILKEDLNAQALRLHLRNLEICDQLLRVVL